MAARETLTIVAMDTATADVAVAAARDGEVLFDARVAPEDGGRPLHAATLLEQVDEAVRAVGGWESVGSLAVGIGPGAFTGLRIGISTARALAQARGLPLVGVVSLAALARAIEGPREALRLALLDARRGEAFAALYTATGEAVWEPFVAPPAEFAPRLAALPEPPLAAGDGALRFREELEAAGASVLTDADPAHRMAARHVCALAEGAPRVAPELVRPIYLRRPDAEVWRERQEAERRGGG